MAIDPEVALLAATAAGALVTEMTTDGWDGAKKAVVALWSRVHPERAETVGAELEGSRAEVLAAVVAGAEQTAAARAESAEEWRIRLRRLLTVDPDVAEQLRTLVAPGGALGRAPGSGNVHIDARAYDNARINVAGRDVNISGS